jgi:FkbM family methyltransferase
MLYARFFARKFFGKFNRLLYHLSLRGLGILNYQGSLTGEKKWLQSFLKGKREPLILDVGANIGNYTKDVFSANPSASVIAFEPHPLTFQRLSENIQSDNFYAHNFALGDAEGILELFDYDLNDGSSHASLYRDVIKDIHKGNPISHEVSIVSLDKFLTDKNVKKIDLLKIDTEGHEYKVLQGSINYLNRNLIDVIHFEFNEMNIVSKSSFKDFWDLLRDYDFFRILPNGELLDIKNYSPINCEIYAFQNIVCVLKESTK